MPNVIKQARLVCVDLNKNNNKLYYLDLQDDGKVRVRYGRYTETSSGLVFQHDDIVDGGEKFFDKKVKEKTRAGRGTGTYVEQPILQENTPVAGHTNKRSLEDIAIKEIKTNDNEVYLLIKNLCKANVHNIVSNSTITYNADSGLFSTPSGLITKEGIDRGRDLLSYIKTHVDSNSFGDTYVGLANEFLSIVPRDLGRRRVDPKYLFSGQGEIEKQLSILDSLEASLTSVFNNTDKDDENKEVEEPKLFDIELNLLNDKKEYDRIVHYYESTSKSMHYAGIGKKVKAIYKIRTPQPYLEFNRKLGNIKELFHGSGQANILAILKSGLKITPPSTAHIAGKLIGNGIYTADCSTKSLNYALGYWGGSNNLNSAFMFVCDVALGNMWTAPDLRGPFPPKGYDSVFGKAGYTGSLLNNEYVVYNENQVLLKYLLEIN